MAYTEHSPTPEPEALYALLAASPHTLGDLLDFADSLPRSWVAPMTEVLMRRIGNDFDTGVQSGPSGRRRLVMLGALLNRMIFEVERIPRRRSFLL